LRHRFEPHTGYLSGEAQACRAVHEPANDQVVTARSPHPGEEARRPASDEQTRSGTARTVHHRLNGPVPCHGYVMGHAKTSPDDQKSSKDVFAGQRAIADQPRRSANPRFRCRRSARTVSWLGGRQSALAADVCDRRRPSVGGLGLGSLWFAMARIWPLATARVQDGIAAGHGRFRSPERNCWQRIAVPARPHRRLPMTHHVEALPPSGENRPGLR
jgi:hypothetical protein